MSKNERQSRRMRVRYRETLAEGNSLIKNFKVKFKRNKLNIKVNKEVKQQKIEEHF